MVRMTSVTLPLRVPCSSTCGPPSHLPLPESASWVLKNTSCAKPSCQTLLPMDIDTSGVSLRPGWAMANAFLLLHGCHSVLTKNVLRLGPAAFSINQVPSELITRVV